jgi:hypothetical protein
MRSTLKCYIEISDPRLESPVRVEFQARDIGLTQGVTIKVPGLDKPHEVAEFRFRPGTQHWLVALNLTESVLRDAYDAALIYAHDCMGAAWLDAAVFRRVIGEKMSPWDGRDIEPWPNDDPEQ